ncbi:response regulator transcription factor [Niastella caeni]|uniref:Response regulator transcription factor n=1 Tax=Niastella caeni TaxID=2569763 RepID=A0A4S8HCZ7_9BACT|nr:response regulator [Niastella caeni]THU32900.1 response regulator transcription factor [Niastella caeni]
MTTLPKILLVDDEEEILDFLERILQPKYTVLKTQHGKEALQALELNAVQLIISDVMMPDMDGFELCRIIKSNVEHSHIPIIMLTAKNTIQAKVQGLELGADAYIEKPFSKEHLQAQIASLLANRNTLREYFASSPLVHINSMAHTRSDEHFLASLHNTIMEHIEEVELDVEQLARHMNMSRVTLYRKIKAISDLTPIELINITRLKKAAGLLAAGDYKMYEIAAMTGFSSQSNFARNFHKQFGVTPTDYAVQKHKEL